MTALRRIHREMMRAEAQRDGHAWASTAAAHAYLGLGLWGGLAVIFDRWAAVYLTPVAYLMLNDDDPWTAEWFWAVSATLNDRTGT